MNHHRWVSWALKLFTIVLCSILLLRLIGCFLPSNDPSSSETKSPANGKGLSAPFYTFIIFTKTTAETIEDRNVLRRKSWLSYNWSEEGLKRNYSSLSWKHFFLVGISLDEEVMKKVKQENATYGDILMSESFSFYSMQIYSIMWMFQHVVNNFNAKFLIKVDDDSIVNVNLLNEYLTKLISDRKDSYFYGGTWCIRRPVLRQGKWKVSPEIFPEDFFPTFCCGAGLIFSMETIIELLRIWKTNHQPVVGLDDAQLGIMVYTSGRINITSVSGVTLGYQTGSNNVFMILSIRPVEKAASLISNYMTTGVYSDQDVTMH